MSMSSQTEAEPREINDSTRGVSWWRDARRMQCLGMSLVALLVKRARAAAAEAAAIETRIDAERQRHHSLRLPHSHRPTFLR